MKNIKIQMMYRLLSYCLLFIPFGLMAQEQLTLPGAISKGLANNFQVQIFEEQLEAAKLNNRWGTVGRFPSIALGATSVNRFDDSPLQNNPNERAEITTNSISPNVTLNWTLFSGFGIKISKDKLDLLERFSEGNSAVIVENTIQSIILGYYGVLLEQEKLEILKAVKKLSGDRFRYEETRRELGSAVTFDVLQAKNSFFSDSSNYLLQELNLKNAILNLNLLLGEPSQNRYVLTDSFEVVAADYKYDDLYNQMLASNKTLLNQYINLEILKKDIGIEKSSLYPVVRLGAGADYSESRIKFSPFDPINTNSFDYYANFTLSFNLYNGGNTRTAIKQAQISEKIGQLETREMEQTLTNLLQNQFDLLGIREQLLEVADVNLESAQLNLEIATEKYKNGSINSFNYRDVQLIYLNAAFQRLEAVYNLVNTQTELLRLTGGIISENQ